MPFVAHRDHGDACRRQRARQPDERDHQRREHNEPHVEMKLDASWARARAASAQTVSRNSQTVSVSTKPRRRPISVLPMAPRCAPPARAHAACRCATGRVSTRISSTRARARRSRCAHTRPRSVAEPMVELARRRRLQALGATRRRRRSARAVIASAAYPRRTRVPSTHIRAPSSGSRRCANAAGGALPARRGAYDSSIQRPPRRCRRRAVRIRQRHARRRRLVPHVEEDAAADDAGSGARATRRAGSRR